MWLATLLLGSVIYGDSPVSDHWESPRLSKLSAVGRVKFLRNELPSLPFVHLSKLDRLLSSLISPVTLFVNPGSRFQLLPCALAEAVTGVVIWV